MLVRLKAETEEFKKVFTGSAARIQSRTSQVWNMKALFATDLVNKFRIIKIWPLGFVSLPHVGQNQAEIPIVEALTDWYKYTVVT